MKSASEYWRRVEDLYHRAAECNGGERQTLLDRDCAGDNDLRREVEALLAGHERARSFLEEPAVGRLTAGIRLSNFEIVERIGSGGMGDVYRARDMKLNRPVAIKFLSADLGDASARRRFQREAQMASSLNHPHILTVHDFGEFEGREYLVTEFVDGGTLREWARREKPSVRRIVDLVIGIADALACAHQAGILHRDIKPENILVSKGNHAKIADFGLAKLIDPENRHNPTGSIQNEVTRPGIILGTLAYMSPEQAAGNPVDARTDVFAFGAVLYELLAGRRAFEGNSNVSLVHSIQHSEPPPLGEIRPDIPAELRNVVEKALEKDSGDRYQSMREMVVDLKRVQRIKSGELPSPAVASRTLTTHPRRIWPLVALVTVAVAIAVTGLLLYRSDIFLINPGSSASIENPLAHAQFTRFTDFPGDETSAAISPDGKFVAFLSDRDGPFDLFVSQVGTGRFTNLTQGKQDGDLRSVARAIGFSADGSEVWYRGSGGPRRRPRLVPLMGGTPRLFLAENVPYMAWSPDGSRLVYHKGGPDAPGDPVFIADRTGADAQQIVKGGHNHDQTWSQDGKWIYYAHGVNETTDLWRIAATGGEPERLTQHNTRGVDFPTPIDDRNVLYTALDQDGSGPWLWAFDVSSKTTRRISFGLEQYTSLAASADGRRVVASVSSPAANLWSVPILDRVAEEGDAKPYPLPAARALTPRFGGNALFYLSSRGTGDGLWRYQDGQALEIWKGADGALSDPPAVSADGSRVAVVLRSGGALHLRVGNADGTEFRGIGETVNVLGSAYWSPDGKWIAVGGNDAKGPGLFKIPVEGGAPTRIHSGDSRDPVWSPDGDLIVFVGDFAGNLQGLLALRPDGSPVELPEIRVSRSGERTRFSPDGKSLIYMQGSQAQDFWILDLATRKSRQLTHLNNTARMRTFDITPDGEQIVFDRLRDNSDIVLIDLPRKPH